jgi:hypothetical protein
VTHGGVGEHILSSEWPLNRPSQCPDMLIRDYLILILPPFLTILFWNISQNEFRHAADWFEDPRSPAPVHLESTPSRSFREPPPGICILRTVRKWNMQYVEHCPVLENHRVLSYHPSLTWRILYCIVLYCLSIHHCRLTGVDRVHCQ